MAMYSLICAGVPLRIYTTHVCDCCCCTNSLLSLLLLFYSLNLYSFSGFPSW